MKMNEIVKRLKERMREREREREDEMGIDESWEVGMRCAPLFLGMLWKVNCY